MRRGECKMLRTLVPGRRGGGGRDGGGGGGGGGGGDHPLTRWAHSESGGRKLHVKWL